jgi:hypothetical protein
LEVQTGSSRPAFKATFEVRAKINGKWLVRTKEVQIHPDYNN